MHASVHKANLESVQVHMSAKEKQSKVSMKLKNARTTSKN